MEYDEVEEKVLKSVKKMCKKYLRVNDLENILKNNDKTPIDCSDGSKLLNKAYKTILIIALNEFIIIVGSLRPFIIVLSNLP